MANLISQTAKTVHGGPELLVMEEDDQHYDEPLVTQRIQNNEANSRNFISINQRKVLVRSANAAGRN